jgi:two-component system phosphate regulon sensor histidine kinase PhoR
MDDTITSAILASMADGVLVISFDGQIVFANRASREILHPDQHEIAGKTYAELFLCGTENDAFNDILFSGIQNRETLVYREVPFHRRDGTFRELAVTTSFLREGDETGQNRGIVVVFKDVTDLRALDQARQRVLDHLSHELRTPLSIIQSTLKRAVPPENTQLLERITHSIERLKEIQLAVDDIVNVRTATPGGRVRGWVKQMQDLLDAMVEEHKESAVPIGLIRCEIARLFEADPSYPEVVDMKPAILKTVEEAGKNAANRQVSLNVNVEGDFRVWIERHVLHKSVMAMIKNAVEATPEGGKVVVALKEEDNRPVVEVRDTGIGITAESQAQIFGGFYHARDTDCYSTKKPFDFGAGGKGLELLRVKIFAELCDFIVECQSRRCPHIPGETQLCPGSIEACRHVNDAKDCARSGGTTMRMIFRRCEEPSGTGGSVLR